MFENVHKNNRTYDGNVCSICRFTNRCSHNIIQIRTEVRTKTEHEKTYSNRVYINNIMEGLLHEWQK